MRTLRALPPLAGIFLVLTMAVFRPVTAAAEHKDIGPAIYDEHADGAQQIADALAIATKQHKRVLLQFGANWCIWCHRLHDLLHADAGLSAALAANYVFVLVDVNKDHNKETDQKYGNPTHLGLPVLVVLDADGKPLTTKDSGELEEGDHHNPQKVMAFLKQWAPGR